MNPSENNDQNELQSEILKSIADGIAGISNHLERLTAAVEGVAESIEKAHEPEGDLAVHLVSSIKDLTSVLRSRIQHERGNQPQHAQRSQILTPQSQNRRNDGHQSDRQSRPQDQYSRNEHARDGDHKRTEGPRDVDPSAHPEKLEDREFIHQLKLGKHPNVVELLDWEDQGDDFRYKYSQIIYVHRT